ncbi:uncharacterized protein LOC115990321 [Quercus lobata]|uniref:uncharacterized protein LOC115990321 n=1 Tax=Quercus lobata TaxID=97700 RepID=UPI001248E6FE|nr:uncharacterized protein LOC115990321 [Quercus lobata]
MDGAASGPTNKAGCGGLIRNDQGNWLMGFSRNIGQANSFMAETWALQLVARFSRCCIRHIYHEANICADKLSRLGLVQSLDFVLHHSPLVDLLPLIEANKHGLYSNRRCPAPYSVL